MTTQQKSLYVLEHILDQIIPAPGYGEPQWTISYDRLDFYIKKDQEIAPGTTCLNWLYNSPDTFKRFLSQLTGLNWTEGKFYHDSGETPVAQ